MFTNLIKKEKRKKKQQKHDKGLVLSLQLQ